MHRTQSNNHDDLHRHGFHQRLRGQQHYLSKLSGGSWSQPPWSGWKPIIGAGVSGGSNILQRYAQDGDSGFFHRGALHGSGEPLGMNPLPPNHLSDDEIQPIQHDAPTVSTIEPQVIIEPSPAPQDSNLVLQANSDAEPEQHALHVPPYSHLMRVQGMGKDGALYEEPFEIPEYKGSLHKRKSKLSR